MTTKMAKMETPAPDRTQRYVVVHPLFDAPEEKLRPDHLPPMPMTLSVRLSLIALRAYLAVMMGMLVYHFLDVVGLLGHHAK